jgi:hypothetical protein
MKFLTFRNVFALSMMMFLVASCGKDKKKKNNCDGYNMYTNAACFGVNQYGFNGLQGAQMGDVSQIAQFTQWYNSPETVGLAGSQGLIDFTDAAFKVGLSSDYCYRLTGPNIFEFGYYQGNKTCTGMAPYSKQNNTRLQEIVALNSGAGQYKLVGVQVSGAQIILFYGINAGSQYSQPVKAYVIDRSKHSMLNPVMIQDATSGSVKTEYLYADTPKSPGTLDFYNY